MPEKIFRSSVNREPAKRRGWFARAAGKLAGKTMLTPDNNPQIRAAKGLSPEHKANIEAVQIATEQTDELRGKVGLAIRQFQELRGNGGGSSKDDYDRQDKLTETREGIPVLTSTMRATIRDPRRVSVDGRDSARGLTHNPLMGEGSKVNHIGMVRVTRVSTDPSRPLAEDKIGLTVESTDERPGVTFGLGRVHGISFSTSSEGKEVIRVMESYKKRDGTSLPPQRIHPEPEQLQTFVDMISAAAMDSHPHQPLPTIEE